MQLPWSWGSSKARTPPKLQEYDLIVERLKDQAALIPPPALVLSIFALGSASTMIAAFVYRRFFRRLRTGDWITPDVFSKKKWIKGVVTRSSTHFYSEAGIYYNSSVGDADNFRLYHTPGPGWRWPIKFRRIPSRGRGVRLCLFNVQELIFCCRLERPDHSHPYSWCGRAGGSTFRQTSPAICTRSSCLAEELHRGQDALLSAYPS
jgi:hypothetical protein